MSKTTNKFSPEVRERAVRLVFGIEGQHDSRWQAVMSIAAKIGCTAQTLNEWIKKARSTAAGARACRLMKDMDIQGIIRGKPHRTTIPDKKQPCPLEKVNRQFQVPAPNMLWVSDFTSVATWKGFVYVAFVIDA